MQDIHYATFFDGQKSFYENALKVNTHTYTYALLLILILFSLGFYSGLHADVKGAH